MPMALAAARYTIYEMTVAGRPKEARQRNLRFSDSRHSASPFEDFQTTYERQAEMTPQDFVRKWKNAELKESVMY